MSEGISADPFRAIHADAWAEPLDVPSLNQDVSDLLLDHLDRVRQGGVDPTASLRSSSVLLLGPAGSGKTHLFARLRKQAGPRAVFILSRPEIGVEPSPRQVLASIVDSLRRPVAGDERRQIDVIVGAMLATLEGGRGRYPFLFLDDAQRLSAEAQRELRERAVARAEDRFPEIDPVYLERLLSVPFAGRQDQRALFSWLSGREPGPVELARLGASSPLADFDLMPALRTLGVVAAYGAPIVLVFDQLENLAEESTKNGRILAHARLVSELRDTVRGLLIVQMALDSEWMTRIHPVLHGSDRARLEETVKMLRLPVPDERRALIERWREALPEALRDGPFPFPFTVAEVGAWTHDLGMTPRMLMQACGEAYLVHRSRGDAKAEAPSADAAGTPAPEGADEALEVQWEQAIAQARGEIDEAIQQGRGVAGERIASGLLAAARVLGAAPGEIVTKPTPSFRVTIHGRERDVIVTQQTHPRSLAAAIRAASVLAADRPVLLLRERALSIPPTWKEVNAQLSVFSATPRASFLPIERDELAKLLALADFLTAARSQDLSNADGRSIPHDEVVRWIERRLDLSTWGPAQAVCAPVASSVASTPVIVAKPPPSGASSGAPPRSAPLRSAPPRSAPPHSASPRAASPLTSTPERAAGGPVLTVLERLRVASLDRLVREAKALDPQVSRASALVELRRSRARILGESIVVLEDA